MFSVTYPGIGPSICDNIFRVRPGVTGGEAPSAADASLATNPVTAQIAQDAKPAKPRRVSMMTLPAGSGLPTPGILCRQ
jgi:hypothetical protein